jgi:hypothetical protein
MREARALGLYGVGIVEHHSLRASAPCERLAPSMGAQVFRGVEIATDRGHLLAFGRPLHGVEDLAAEIRAGHCIGLRGPDRQGNPFSPLSARSYIP